MEEAEQGSQFPPSFGCHEFGSEEDRRRARSVVSRTSREVAEERQGQGGQERWCANGKSCREFVEFVDLVPTLGELVRLDLPDNLEGTSFAPLLVNPSQTWKKAVFMVDGNGGQMVRTREFSYLVLKKGPVSTALYDLENDQWETVNLADDPDYASVRQEMAARLEEGWKAALPPTGSPG